MRIALVNLPMVWQMNPGEIGRSLGLEYLAAVAGQDGHQVQWIDAFGDRLGRAETVSLLSEGGFDFIGLSINDDSLPRGLEICEGLQAATAHVCLGGYGATFWAEEILASQPRVDSIVYGEGEWTFRRLLARLSTGEDWRNTRGVAYRIGDRVTVNPPRPLIEDLDEIPPLGA